MHERSERQPVRFDSKTLVVLISLAAICFFWFHDRRRLISEHQEAMHQANQKHRNELRLDASKCANVRKAFQTSKLEQQQVDLAARRRVDDLLSIIDLTTSEITKLRAEIEALGKTNDSSPTHELR